MFSKYGIPYKGSKSRLADKIIDYMPAANNFIDLFAGGCAMTQAAAQCGKYSAVYTNDLCQMPVRLFLRACAGDLPPIRWVSRAEFLANAATDPIAAYCWSFGNCARTYIFGRELEDWKHALFNARVFGDFSMFKKMNINTNGTTADIKANIAEYKAKYVEYYTATNGHDAKAVARLERYADYWRIEGLDRLLRLQQLNGTPTDKIKTSFVDYRAVPVPPNSVIYCDIPYIGKKGTRTAEYMADGGMANEFSHADFYKWAAEQTAPVFVSSYDMPADEFVRVLNVSIFSGYGRGARPVSEGLFVPIHQYKADKPRGYQFTIFDYCE